MNYKTKNQDRKKQYDDWINTYNARQATEAQRCSLIGVQIQDSPGYDKFHD